MAQNFVSKAKWDFISTWLKTTGDNKTMATSGGRIQKNAIYIQEKLKPQMKNLECQTKEVGEECGWNEGPLGSLSYGRSETAETSCLCVWTQRCLP